MANVMQTLSDLATLAKAGLKAEEIKEIIALTKEDGTKPEAAPEITPKEVVYMVEIYVKTCFLVLSKMIKRYGIVILRAGNSVINDLASYASGLPVKKS